MFTYNKLILHPQEHLTTSQVNTATTDVQSCIDGNVDLSNAPETSTVSTAPKIKISIPSATKISTELVENATNNNIINGNVNVKIFFLQIY